MSVRVEPNELAEQLAIYGNAPFLLTTSDNARPHATHVVVALDDGRLSASVGRKTAANAGARPAVSLLWPPVEPGGYSLIVDGDAIAASDGDQHSVTVTVTAAVLHRNAAPDAGYQADCQPLDNR